MDDQCYFCFAMSCECASFLDPIEGQAYFDSPKINGDERYTLGLPNDVEFQSNDNFSLPPQLQQPGPEFTEVVNPSRHHQSNSKPQMQPPARQAEIGGSGPLFPATGQQGNAFSGTMSQVPAFHGLGVPMAPQPVYDQTVHNGAPMAPQSVYDQAVHNGDLMGPQPIYNQTVYNNGYMGAPQTIYNQTVYNGGPIPAQPVHDQMGFPVHPTGYNFFENAAPALQQPPMPQREAPKKAGRPKGSTDKVQRMRKGQGPAKPTTFKTSGRPTNEQRRAIKELDELEKEIAQKELSGLPSMELYNRREELRAKANLKDPKQPKKSPSP
jgi:hypothetical protein